MARKRIALRGQHLAVYGNVRIPRAKCPDCKDMAFVIDGKMACCDLPFLATPRSVQYLIPPQSFRKSPPKHVREALLAQHKNACAYCGQAFGALVYRGNTPTVLRLSWDHFIPFIWTGDNSDSNFIPSCHVCNERKHDKVFNDLVTAQKHLRGLWGM